MSQIDMRSHYAQEDTTNEPISVYVEEDDEEEFEDEMGGEDDEDGDMMEVRYCFGRIYCRSLFVTPLSAV